MQVLLPIRTRLCYKSKSFQDDEDDDSRTDSCAQPSPDHHSSTGGFVPQHSTDTLPDKVQEAHHGVKLEEVHKEKAKTNGDIVGASNRSFSNVNMSHVTQADTFLHQQQLNVSRMISSPGGVSNLSRYPVVASMQNNNQQRNFELLYENAIVHHNHVDHRQPVALPRRNHPPVPLPRDSFGPKSAVDRQMADIHPPLGSSSNSCTVTNGIPTEMYPPNTPYTTVPGSNGICHQGNGINNGCPANGGPHSRKGFHLKPASSGCSADVWQSRLESNGRYPSPTVPPGDCPVMANIQPATTINCPPENVLNSHKTPTSGSVRQSRRRKSGPKLIHISPEKSHW